MGNGYSSESSDSESPHGSSPPSSGRGQEGVVAPPPGATVHCVAVWENQRRYVLIGWSDYLLFTDPFPWSSADNTEALERSDAILPHGCQWTGPWAVDTPSADSDGWTYSSSFEDKFVPQEDANRHWVRRRRWIRPFVVVSEDEFSPSKRLSLAELAERQKPLRCRHVIFVNPKSGGNLGSDLLKRFLNDQRAAGDIGIFSLIPNGPKEGLKRLTWTPESRILVCGGDGTVAWVLSEVDEYLEESKKDPDVDDPPLPPACGILPLGTGNDLARVFGWGPGYEGQDSLQRVLEVLESAEVELLDRWDVELHPRTASALATDCDCLNRKPSPAAAAVAPEELEQCEEAEAWRDRNPKPQAEDEGERASASSLPSSGDTGDQSPPDDDVDLGTHPDLESLDLQSPESAFDAINQQTPKDGAAASNSSPSSSASSSEASSPSSSSSSSNSSPSRGSAQQAPRHRILCNYFGIGIDAEIALSFHEEREANPERFQSRLGNQAQYGLIGFEKALFTECADLNKYVSLFVDDRLIPLRDDIEAVVVLNIPSFGAGCDIWGGANSDGFEPQAANDGLLEVVGIKGSAHLARIQLGLSWNRGIRLAQGRKVSIHTRKALPVQVDGEPWLHPPACIRFELRTKSRMLRCTEPL